jgi:hypothetical protein
MTCRHAVPASQSHQATCRTLFKERIRLFFGIVGPVALAQFALGFIPECVFATLGPAGRLPQLVGAGADLLNGRDAHLRTHKPSWPKSQRGLLQLVPLRTRTSGSFRALTIMSCSFSTFTIEVDGGAVYRIPGEMVRRS